MDREDKLYGSLIAIVLSIIGGVCSWFGASKEITWLCIVGFVVTAIAVLAAVITVKITAILLFVISLFTSKWVFSKWLGGKLKDTWFYYSGGLSIFYFARVMLVLCIVTLFFSAISLQDSQK